MKLVNAGCFDKSVSADSAMIHVEKVLYWPKPEQQVG